MIRYEPKNKDKVSYGKLVIIIVSVFLIVVSVSILLDLYGDSKSLKNAYIDAKTKYTFFLMNLSTDENVRKDIIYGERVIVDILDNEKTIDLRGVSDTYNPEAFYQEGDERVEIRVPK